MTVLVADIGATHARFALASPDAREVSLELMMVAGLATLEDALSGFLATKGIAATTIEAAVISAAGPVRADGSIHMTNCPWVADPRAIGAAHGFKNILVLNDMTAAALGLLRLAPEDIETLGGGEAAPDAPKAILAPGTGLGVSGLIPCAGGAWTPLASEGGHVDLAPHDDREIAIVFHLLRKYGHASPERILSGLGLETLYETLTALDGSGAAALGPIDIATAARRGEAQAAEAIKLFCGWLGSVAGDLALILGARGGVYIGGGIVPQWGDLFDRELFRHRFLAKGRFNELLDPIPTYLVTRKDLALLGCVEKAKQLLR